MTGPPTRASGSPITCAEYCASVGKCCSSTCACGGNGGSDCAYSLGLEVCFSDPITSDLFDCAYRPSSSASFRCCCS